MEEGAQRRPSVSRAPLPAPQPPVRLPGRHSPRPPPPSTSTAGPILAPQNHAQTVPHSQGTQSCLLPSHLCLLPAHPSLSSPCSPHTPCHPHCGSHARPLPSGFLGISHGAPASPAGVLSCHTAPQHRREAALLLSWAERPRVSVGVVEGCLSVSWAPHPLCSVFILQLNFSLCPLTLLCPFSYCKGTGTHPLVSVTVFIPKPSLQPLSFSLWV